MERLVNLLRVLLVGIVYTSVLYRYYWVGIIEGSFVRRASIIIAIWMYTSAMIYWVMRKEKEISKFYKYLSTTLDIGMLSAAIILTGDQSTSLVAGYYLIVAFSATRFHWPTPAYAGLLSALSYFSSIQFVLSKTVGPSWTLTHLAGLVSCALVVGFATKRKETVLRHIGVTQHDRDVTQKLLEQYVDHPTANNILNDTVTEPHNKHSHGQIDASVMVADIRGFGPVTAKLDNTDIVPLLNEFFDQMLGVVQDTGGTIDKFLGDGFLAVFNHENNRQHRRRALECAQVMQDELALLNKNNPQWPDLTMGIGINDGNVLVGEVGGYNEKEYTILGPSVNIADRLQSMAASGDIIIGGKKFQALANNLGAEKVPQRTFSSSKKPITIYRLRPSS